MESLTMVFVSSGWLILQRPGYNNINSVRLGYSIHSTFVFLSEKKQIFKKLIQGVWNFLWSSKCYTMLVFPPLFLFLKIRNKLLPVAYFQFRWMKNTPQELFSDLVNIYQASCQPINVQTWTWLLIIFLEKVKHNNHVENWLRM